jgi:quercetin dioxygenase-like cupin family protein
MTRPYTVKSVATVAQAPGLLVREFTFAPGEATPWHLHSEVSDRTYVLAGVMACETEAGRTVLHAGDSHCLPPRTRHRLVNDGAADARLLLIQHGGRYDFVRDEPKA